MYNPMIQVGDRIIGRDFPVFVIAEAACNHECDMDVAKKMIDTAKAAGADAVKFQTYKAEYLVSGKAKAYWKDEDMLQIDYYKQLDKFGKEHYAELFDYAKDRNIIAFSTPFDLQSATMLAEVGVPLMKIASCDITNLGLIRHVASLGLPIIMSTGGGTGEDVIKAVRILKTANVPFALMGCVLLNPAPLAKLNRIHVLRDLFADVPVGYSDHTVADQTIIPMMAVAAGAVLYEKHFTIDKSMNISNHFFAADPTELAETVFAIRRAEILLGQWSFDKCEKEAAAYEVATRSWHTCLPIKKGEQFTEEHLKYIRPGTGLQYDEVRRILGSVATRDLEVDTMIKEGYYE
jgi:N,N'-diacetyllegionaminate synthase